MEQPITSAGGSRESEDLAMPIWMKRTLSEAAELGVFIVAAVALVLGLLSLR
jgi:hypothetical protein